MTFAAGLPFATSLPMRDRRIYPNRTSPQGVSTLTRRPPELLASGRILGSVSPGNPMEVRDRRMNVTRALTLSNRLGTYELVRPLAQGGMADIYLARRLGPGQFQRHVAVKVLSRQRAADLEACAMFLDEARLVAMLNHHNIASVLEVDVVDGKHYLAMEYVHGADLRDVLTSAQRAGTPLPFETSLSIV